MYSADWMYWSERLMPYAIRPAYVVTYPWSSTSQALCFICQDNDVFKVAGEECVVDQDDPTPVSRAHASNTGA